MIGRSPDNLVAPALARAGAHAGRLRATAHRREHRRALITGCAALGLAALATVVAIVTERSPSDAGSAGHPARSTPRDARITDEINGSCRVFDNQTGRIRPAREPCDEAVLDRGGVPVPSGTIHRLDAISKSFSGN
jgi:hypothetical protein